MQITSTTFSFLELLCGLGLAQAGFVFVRIVTGMTSVRAALPYIGYFFMAGAAFALQFFYRYIHPPVWADVSVWLAWSMTVPFGVLIILSMLLPGRRIHPAHYIIVLIVPVALMLTLFNTGLTRLCAPRMVCNDMMDILFIAGVIAQTLCFAGLYSRDISRSNFFAQQRAGERYWLIISFCVVNLAMIGQYFWYLNREVTLENLALARVLLGLAFIYIVSTFLFRVYPPVLNLRAKTRQKTVVSPEDTDLKHKIENLMIYDKLYQEPSFSRSDLARELEVSESRISAIIKNAFGMNFSRFINGYRVNEAKERLIHTEQAIGDIAAWTGFNSIASFNRVFKTVTGHTPTAFRKMHTR